jgi:hypothetical protein
MTDLPTLPRGQRSIRHPTPIDSALIRKVCDDAVAGASSSGNLNRMSIALTGDPDRKRRLNGLHMERPTIRTAGLSRT